MEAAYYRAKAQNMREQARATRDEVGRQELLQLANEYELEARRAETERGQPSISGSPDS
jgi:hypothetical protein